MEIYTAKTFRYETAKPRDYVVGAMVDEVINCWPFSRVHAHKWGGAIVIGKTRKPVGGVRATLLSSDAAICPASGNTAGIAFGVRRWSVARIRSAAERFVL